MLPLAGKAAVLGNIAVQSALGQPLRATIPFTSNGPDDVIENSCISLRSPTKSTQSASPYLTRARLNVENLNGKQQISITGTTITNEPAITLQLHITCAKEGEFVREFTVLLDPPEYAKIQAPVTTSTPLAAVKNSTKSVGQPSQVAMGERYEVLQEDSLENIARSAFPRSKSKQKRFIRATKQANPDVFDASGSNTIPAGSVLFLPEKEAIQARRTPQAQPAAEQQQSAPAPKSVKAPSKREAAKNDQRGFELKLATGELDLSPAKDLTDEQRDILREQQLMIASDDQVATILALKNQIKVLEARMSEMQLKLSNRISETDKLKLAIDSNKANIDKTASQNNIMMAIYWLIGGLLTALLGYAALVWHRKWKSNQTFSFSSDKAGDHDSLIPEQHEPLPRRVYVQSTAASGQGLPASPEQTTQGEEEENLYNPNSIFQKDESSISLTEFDSVIDEADLYLVYGWTQKAIDLLKDHIQRIKTDVPPWMMLADIYRSNHMEPEFIALATEFKSHFGDTEWWPKLQNIGKEFSPQTPLFQVEPATEIPTKKAVEIKEETVPPPDIHAMLDEGLIYSVDEPARKENLPPPEPEPIDDMLEFDFTPLRKDQSKSDTPEDDDPFSALAPDDHKINVKRTFSNDKNAGDKGN
ncbi:type IV pilus assembly protein FimV [Sulfurirhabdus autotrophica]|uniref:Tfp pilus assembly protein FimV n=2 Tax=Sulfurirhabdus autotrophica TaxID=1706046 RepID=A0A4R3Y2P9_9PROT|nr:hypothetical protein [Sulfurirhabdus autotrophica]TCV86445.1 Tfp pilus assembly protein FimV [Sulfurirhabdus autotrophica]